MNGYQMGPFLLSFGANKTKNYSYFPRILFKQDLIYH